MEEKNAKVQRRKGAKAQGGPKTSGKSKWAIGATGLRLENKRSPEKRSPENRNPRTGKKAKKAWESNRGIRWAAGERSSGPEENGFFCEPMVRRKSLAEERVGLARALGFG